MAFVTFRHSKIRIAAALDPWLADSTSDHPWLAALLASACARIKEPA